MVEYGHTGIIGNGICLDAWGAGPFIMPIAGRARRFEDSARFGPMILTKNDDPSSWQPGENHIFWDWYERWVRDGRRVEDDGMTCIVAPPKDTLYRMVGRRRMLVQEGDRDGKLIDVSAAPQDACRGGRNG